jgi:UDPglucose 6-dehydrogenase
MNLTIIGQDTLAAATTECCRKHFNVQSAPDEDTELIWFCYDTPIGADDAPDVEWVIDQIGSVLSQILGHHRPLILVSSQIPVGTMLRLETLWPWFEFAYSPENILVASAVADFTNQARIVVGTRHNGHQELFEKLFFPFTQHIIFTDTETAEMVKHTLNCYLGLCIAFINEIAKVCAAVGVDAGKVSEALLAERRVSPNAPLRPGKPFGLGHIARDIYVLNEVGNAIGLSLPIIENITRSNQCSPPTPKT